MQYRFIWVCFELPNCFSKVHIFWEGHKILQNLHRRFDHYYIGQITKILCSSLNFIEFDIFFICFKKNHLVKREMNMPIDKNNATSETFLNPLCFDCSA